VWEISSGKLLKRDGWICINTDGAAKGNMIVGCGGVLRGEHREWLCGFSKCLGVRVVRMLRSCGVCWKVYN
jgi:hypothetical protein